MPVPTAVPPSGSSRTRGSTDSSPARRRGAAWRRTPPSPGPSVTGVASIRCVRPALTVSANSSALASNAVASRSSAGTRSSTTASVAATWMLVGKVSLLLCEALTWSLGWTSTPARAARVAITSLAFMLELVPEPVWKTSSGNSPSCSPATIASAASTMACACSWVTHPQRGVGARGGRLDVRQRLDVPGLERQAADREVLDRALGLGPPEGVARHLDLAHGVVLGACLAHGARRYSRGLTRRCRTPRPSRTGRRARLVGDLGAIAPGLVPGAGVVEDGVAGQHLGAEPGHRMALAVAARDGPAVWSPAT